MSIKDDTITGEMRRLEVCMQYDCQELVELIINEPNNQVRYNNLLEDYKEKKAKFLELKAEFEKEFLVR